MEIDKLQIVVIEDLKDFWDDPDMRQIYSDMLHIKFEGYGRVYGSNVVSADKADFFGTHLMVCERGLRLKPLFGYKSVTLDKCQEFHLNFPAFSLVGSDGHEDCYSELRNIVNRAESRGERVSFDYSWAQTPSLKAQRSKEAAQLFRDLVMVMVVHHHRSYNIPHMLTCGVEKVKTDLFFERMGLEKISQESRFAQKDLNGDFVHIFHGRTFSDYALEVARRYESLWENRLEFSKSRELLKSQAA